MLIKIGFAFTGVFKLQNVIINQIHFNTLGWGLYPGKLKTGGLIHDRRFTV